MLSHGHWDHAGGLTKALDLIVTAKGCKDYCQMSVNELSRFKWKERRHVETFNCKTVFTWSTFQCILCRIFISRRERCTLLFTSWNVQVVALANQSFVNQTITDFRNQQDLFQIHSRQGSDVFTAINNAGREESPFQTQLSCQWKRFGFFKPTKIIFRNGYKRT